MHVLPAFWINATARRSSGTQFGLLALAINPTLSMGLGLFFNQYQELFVSGRTYERRFGLVFPDQSERFGYKLAQFRQHTLVNRRIKNHPGAPVDLRLSRFELRFD